MKKLSKFALKQANVDQSDILKKKQMRNLWGGREICTWCCTIDAEGTCSGSGATGQNWGTSCDECWRDAEFFCTYPDYGIWIQCK